MNTNKTLQNIRLGWSPFVVIAVTTLAAIAISIYCLSRGWVIIFQNLFYFPIIIVCVYYAKKGFAFSVVLSFIYLFLIISFTRNSTVAIEALIRVFIFVGVAGVITFLSIMRKRMEEVLSISEVRYRRLFETAKDGILILNAETGIIVDVNPFLVEMLGFSHEQFVGKAIWKIGPFKDIASNKDKFIELQRQEYVRYENLPLETADGRRIEVEFVSNVYTVDHQKVIQCNIRDITERKRMEEELRQHRENLEKLVKERMAELKQTMEALRASEVRYRRLFETAKDGILILNAETGLIVDVNPFLVKMLGFSHEQLMGKAIWEIGFFKDIASNKDKFIELQRRRYVRYENLPLETADGRQIEVEFVSNVYIVDHKRVVQCNLRDITERKREEREIEEKLMETMKMKSDFISMVSHELRTPLTVIKEGIALIADGSMGEINEEQKELLGLSKKHVDRLAKFINAVLDLQKLEVGGMKLNAQPNDINEIVRDVYEMMTLATKDRGADLLLELDDRLPRVGFDNDKITQVLTNLVANAMKFTEKGNIVIKTSKKNGMIHVSVSDTGCGIKKKDLSRVFGRFEQLSTGGERKTGGTGLGLAICKGIIEQHNGEIWVDSVFGKGSKFTFTLPIYNIEEPFRKYVNDGIKEASTNNTRMSLVFISIADFDKLKQKLSHEKITSTLKDVEAILENDLHRGKGRPNQITDTVFRFSNEIFIVLANCSKENIPVVKERLEQKLDDYLADKNLVDKVKLFFGCVTYPDDAVTSEELIKKAKELHPIVSTALSV
jgi:PAS domain S-box-containing protein